MNHVVSRHGLLQERTNYEQQAYRSGFRRIAGLDEAGRGPLAGPVVAACVILPANYEGLEEIVDSKKLSAKKRQELFILIHEQAQSIGVGIVDAPTIDQINILQATFLAMRKALQGMHQPPDYCLIDGNQRPTWLEQGQTLVNGEDHSLSIAAASIIAKVTRDQIMTDYDHHFPKWGFGQHKGYGTAAHLEAIKQHGICDLHRKSFSPISKIIHLH